MTVAPSVGTRSAPASEMIVRPYTDTDEAATLQVLTDSLGTGPGGRRSPEFFRWKHQDNPFGRSFILVAESEDRIVGVRALMRWQFVTNGALVRAVRAVDTATHPDWQGRGLFTRLTSEAVDRLRTDTDFIFNTPNQKSLPGYLKMGWRTVGKIPVAVKVRRPIRFIRRLRRLNDSILPSLPGPRVEALTVSEALGLSGLEELLGARNIGRRLSTPRDLTYLQWRYGSAPLLDYRAVVEERDGAVSGLAIFRVRARGPLWESTVCELIARPDDAKTRRSLLAKVASSAAVDHITCHFPVRSLEASAARRAGFLPSPGGMTFVVNSLRNAQVDPLDAASWALSLGDLEVF